MNRMIKPSSLLLYFLSIVVFFVVGLLIAKWTGAGKNQMLAGGAIVFFYGLVSTGIAFIVSLFLVYGADHRIIIGLNKILAVLFLIIASFAAYKAYTREKVDKPTVEYPKKASEPNRME